MRPKTTTRRQGQRKSENKKDRRCRDQRLKDEALSLSPDLEAAHDEGNDNVALLFRHLGADGQQHQHVVALGHAHGVQVAQHVGTRYLALDEEEAH